MGFMPRAVLVAFPLVAAFYLLRLLRKRMLTLVASSPTPWIARLMSGIVSTYKFTEDEFFKADGAPPDVQAKRRQGLDALQKSFDAQTGPKAKEVLRRPHKVVSVPHTDFLPPYAVL